MKETGLKGKGIKFSDSVLRRIVRDYTRESGVRTLEKTIGAVCRKLAKAVLLEEHADLSVTVKRLPDFLGPVKFLTPERKQKNAVGLVTGLAWTQVGGVTYVRRRAESLDLPVDFNQKTDIHIHLPEGAIPKDGPSAGITMATAIASALTGQPVRHDVAMTGEITLRGNVLPVGGIKEKIIAAHRAGIKKILLPEANKRDMSDVPQTVKDDVKFVFVNHMDQVLEQALVK